MPESTEAPAETAAEVTETTESNPGPAAGDTSDPAVPQDSVAGGGFGLGEQTAAPTSMIDRISAIEAFLDSKDPNWRQS